MLIKRPVLHVCRHCARDVRVERVSYPRRCTAPGRVPKTLCLQVGKGGSGLVRLGGKRFDDRTSKTARGLVVSASACIGQSACLPALCHASYPSTRPRRRASHTCHGCAPRRRLHHYSHRLGCRQDSRVQRRSHASSRCRRTSDGAPRAIERRSAGIAHAVCRGLQPGRPEPTSQRGSAHRPGRHAED
jgi:hypothetical protein